MIKESSEFAAESMQNLFVGLTNVSSVDVDATST